MQLDLFSEVYYDIETQLSAGEVGGWENIHLMRVAVAVTWSPEDGFRQWEEPGVPQLIRYLSGFGKVFSFNGDGFDSRVLSHYGDVSQVNGASFDLLTDLKRRLNHRLSLDSLAQATLNVGKTANGLQSLQWWKEGKVQLIADYCRQDVKVLVDLVSYARHHGFVRYSNRTSGEIFTVKVNW